MFGAMAFAAKLSSAHLSGSQVAMIRFAIGLMPVLLIPNARRKAFTFGRVDLLLYRGVFGGLSVLCYFLAIEHTSVGVATLLNYTAPLFSGMFSILFIGEKITSRVLLAIPVALLGVYLVVSANGRPGQLLGFGRWELVGFASACFSGAAVTAIRAARRTENSWSVYTSFCAFGLLTTAPFGLMTWKTPHGSEWAALAATAVLSIGAQLLMTFSLRWVDAMTVGVISQVAVLVSMSLGMLFLGDVLAPRAALGAALTLAGVMGVVYFTSLAKPAVIADEVAPEA
jgi:drug/metabolite transporter (DMT)-like permease